MAAHTTKPYRNSFSGSVGAGMGSLFNPAGRRYFILEHKVSSKYHKAGESQEIIVDNIEIGRDPHCQVRFDESFNTVSRHHAGIVKDGDNWKLVQISKTNKTLLNGHPVNTEWYLHNGDEIQLSVNGPKLGFIIPSGNKATVGSIGLSRRLSLFRQQALAPYRYAITVLSILLVLSIGGLGTWNYFLHDDIKGFKKELADANEKNEHLIHQIEDQRKKDKALIDSLNDVYNRRIAAANKKAAEALVKANERATTSLDGDLTPLHPYVFKIEATPIINGERTNWGWVGTGFLLNDGKFVTARHVTTPYYSNTYRIRDGEVYCGNSYSDRFAAFRELYLNMLYMAGKAVIEYKVSSVAGTTTFTSKEVKEDGEKDIIHTLQSPFSIEISTNNGETETLTIPAGSKIREGALGYYDFAYIETNLNGGLVANREASVNLDQGTNLHILGYPHGWGENNPYYSTAICAQNGLSDDFGGTIMVSNNNTEGGNSGGPVFIQGESGFEVVAIVSGSNYTKGRFVPIAVIP